MKNSLSILHQQFQSKQLQLAQVSNKIHDFIQSYKRKLQDDRAINVQKISSTREQLKQIKSDFCFIKSDIQEYRNIPNSFISMIVQLPQIYENIWESRQQKLIRNYQIKEEECKLLKKKLAQKQNDSHQIRLEVEDTQCREKGSNEEEKKQIFEVMQKQGTDSYIDNMQIKDDSFDKISQQFSEQEDQSSLTVLQQSKYIKHLNCERFCSIKSYQTPFQLAYNRLNKNNSIPNINNYPNKSQQKVSASFAPESNSQKTNVLGDKSKRIKNNKKSTSQNKQNQTNTQFLQLSSRLFGTESQILGSRMNDFRRMLLSRNKNLKEI